MSSHAKLSTSNRVLSAFVVLIFLSFAFAMLPSTSDAKRPKKETATPTTQSQVADSLTAYDTTVPPLEEFWGVEVEPGMIYREPPIYPLDVESTGIGGEVWVSVGVDMRGVVRAVRLKRSSGHASLDHAALSAAWKCRFVPGMQNQASVAAWFTYPVGFAPARTASVDGAQSRAIGIVELDTTLPGPTDSQVVDIQPELIHIQPLVYPDGAKSTGITGQALVKSLIDRSGKVREVMIAKSTGHESLDSAAVDAAWKNRYIPAKSNGKSVATWITYRVDFKLSDK